VSRDPYEVLGVAPGASPQEVHDAYRRLVKANHPDRNPASERAARAFREIQAAYQELQDSRAQSRAGTEKRRTAATTADGDALRHAAVDVRFGKIASSVRVDVSKWVARVRRHPRVRQLSRLIESLDAALSRSDRR
jgi:curved DNA-binding protein CbpA